MPWSDELRSISDELLFVVDSADPLADSDDDDAAPLVVVVDEVAPSPGFDLCSFFHFIRRFWNQIFI